MRTLGMFEMFMERSKEQKILIDQLTEHLDRFITNEAIAQCVSKAASGDTHAAYCLARLGGRTAVKPENRN
jgi:hypothetical protein